MISEMADLCLAMITHPHRHVRRGGFAFLILSFYGVRLIYRAWTHQHRDWLGHEIAPRWMYFLSGTLLQLPFIAYVLFVRAMAEL